MDTYLHAIQDYHDRLRCKNIIFIGGNHDRIYHLRRGDYVPNRRFWEIFRSQSICSNCDSLIPKEKDKCYVCGCKYLEPYHCIHPMGYEMKITRKMCSEHGIPAEYEKLNVTVTHYSHRVWNKSHVGNKEGTTPLGKSINLYGHSHGGLPGMRNAFDVAWNVWYRPVSLLEILTTLMPKHNESDLGKVQFAHHENTRD